MEKVVLHCSLSPGDVVMLTAAVEALHRAYPGRYQTDVRTPCPALWRHNPYITRLDAQAPGVRHIHCHYPLIHQSNRLSLHFIHGYIRHLAEQLGVPLEPCAFRGNIHLGEEELRSDYAAQVVGDSAKPFWVLSAGGKFDYTIKWWHRRRWQAVVDHFQDRITFVQIGERGHYHPPLARVVDMRGRTSLRQLVLLVHRAAGVLCPVTLPMHLAAAVPRPEGQTALRPCVVVAGGREPVQWEAYPGHQFLHTVGSLPCCAHGGCWKARTLPIGDGSPNDAPEKLCERPTPAGLPRCMELIEPRHVINAIEFYLDGWQSLRAETLSAATPRQT